MQMKTTFSLGILLMKYKNASMMWKTFLRVHMYVITGNSELSTKFWLLRLQKDEQEEANCDFAD